jgi:inorganic triphosphatase YgiF
MATETELKLNIAIEDIDRFFRHPVVKSAKTLQKQQLIATYFDTPDYKLRKIKTALRVRREGKLWIQALKNKGTTVSGLHKRQEFEAEVKENIPDFSKLPKNISQSLENIKKNIIPVFTTDILRNTWLIKCQDGSLIELCLDRGVVKTKDKKVKINEIELELKSGNTVNLYEKALELQECLHLTIEQTSKAQRGYDLYSKSTSQIYPVSPVKLPKKTNIEQAFTKILWNCLEYLQNNENAVLHGKNDQAVVEMLIALRKMNAIFSMYESVVPHYTHSELRENINWLREQLNDVYYYSLLHKCLASLCDIYKDNIKFKKLDIKVIKQYKSSYKLLCEILRSKNYSRLLLSLSYWLENRSWHKFLDKKECKKLKKPISKFVMKKLKIQHESLSKRGDILILLTKAQLYQIQIDSLLLVDRMEESCYKTSKINDYLNNLSDLTLNLGNFIEFRTVKIALNKLKFSDEDITLIRAWYVKNNRKAAANLENKWQVFLKQKPFW